MPWWEHRPAAEKKQQEEAARREIEAETDEVKLLKRLEKIATETSDMLSDKPKGKK